MKTFFVSAFLSAALLIPINTVEAVVQPKASCGDASFVINNLPQDERKVAVRVNDKANGWNLEKPLKGDFADKITPQDGEFHFKAVDGHTYSWWVHIENADGTFGSAIGGDTYCGAAAPTTLSATCKDESLSLTWKKVSSAERYAVRIDDTRNTWDVKNTLPGDTAEDYIKGTKFSKKAQAGHGYNVWIHAVDKDGVFSSAKETFVSCRTAAKSTGFVNSLKSFFTGLFS
jgi:hypothetical protein